MTSMENPLLSFRNVPSGNTNVNDLPPEILAHVFTYLLEPMPEPFPFPLADSFHHWQVITRVSQFWRTTALSTPSLWQRIHIAKTSDEMVLQYLPLSGDLPLEVYYTANLSDVPDSDGPEGLAEDEVLKAVTVNMARIQELHISSPLTEAYSLWKYLTTPATLLKSLTIISTDEDDIGAPLVLPPICNGEMACLRKLVLANVSLWPHDSFHNLTHLALYDQLDEARLPLHTFLNTLSQSLQLETLILVGAGLEDDFIFDTTNLVKPVSLTCLRYLEIGDWSYEMVPLTFLKCVTLPSETTLCLWNLGWEADFRNLLFPRVDDQSLLQRCTKINITCFIGGDHTCEADTLIGVKGTTIYYYATAVPPGISALRAIGHFINVTELNYCPDVRWSKYGNIIDENLLLMLPALKILRVSKAIWGNLEKLCHLLIQTEPNPRRPQQKAERDTEDTTPIPSRQPRFRIAPLLEELHINHPYDHPDFHERVTQLVFEDVQSLFLLANVRANNGVGLKRVVIQGCHEDVHDELSAHFERVEFMTLRYRIMQYWEDSVDEIWERGKLPRPPQPD